jgi:hypothetical protein
MGVHIALTHSSFSLTDATARNSPPDFVSAGRKTANDAKSSVRSFATVVHLVRIEAHDPLPIIKADNTMLKERHSADEIKADTKMLRKSDLPRKAIVPELQINHMEKYGDEPSIANLNVDLFSFLPVNPERAGEPRLEHTVECS